VRALGTLLAAIIGALACGSLFFALGALVALEAFAAGFLSGDQTYVLVLVAITTFGAVGGAWLGARVFRWLAAGQSVP
jgi:hypothetical protein